MDETAKAAPAGPARSRKAGAIVGIGIQRAVGACGEAGDTAARAVGRADWRIGGDAAEIDLGTPCLAVEQPRRYGAPGGQPGADGLTHPVATRGAAHRRVDSGGCRSDRLPGRAAPGTATVIDRTREFPAGATARAQHRPAAQWRAARCR